MGAPDRIVARARGLRRMEAEPQGKGGQRPPMEGRNPRKSPNVHDPRARETTMRSGLAAAIGLAVSGVVASGLGASAQTGSATEAPRQNPNVPAITGDRQAVPMGGNNRPEALGSKSGSATGLITMEQRPRLREYALQHRSTELKIQTDLRIGTILPPNAVLLDIPPEFNLAPYKVALANQKTLLVDAANRQVLEVLE